MARPGRHFVEHNTKGEDVDSVIDGIRLDLLGRHVGHRAPRSSSRGRPSDVDILARALCARFAREDEVEIDTPSSVRYVGRLSLAMDEPLPGRGAGVGTRDEIRRSESRSPPSRKLAIERSLDQSIVMTHAILFLIEKGDVCGGLSAATARASRRIAEAIRIGGELGGRP